MGDKSSADEKVKIPFAYVETVGWYFDLRYSHCFVVLLKKKIETMAYYLFGLIPPGTTQVPAHVLRSLAGRLCWYSAALPLGRAFIYAFFLGRAAAGTGLVKIRRWHTQ